MEEVLWNRADAVTVRCQAEWAQEPTIESAL
jgi:hypothetical protein